MYSKNTLQCIYYLLVLTKLYLKKYVNMYPNCKLLTHRRSRGILMKFTATYEQKYSTILHFQIQVDLLTY